MRNRQLYTLAALMGATLLSSEVAGNAQQVPLHPAAASSAVNVTFKPYIQPGDASTFASADVMALAWQTDETAPSAAYSVVVSDGGMFRKAFTPTGRVVDNYLAADTQFSKLTLPRPDGAHVDYFTALTGLAYNTAYTYTISGPGLPPGGFVGAFHTRKTGTQFTVEVQGDEGYYPGVPNSNPPRIVNYEARIIREMYHVDALTALNGGIAGVPALPKPDLALNTGDNVYVTGSDGNYKDVWFDSWNSDADSNDDGAPFLRSIPLYIVVGNHDIGGSGASANLLADSGATVPGQFGPGSFGGGVGGGDAMAHFNNFYDPLNGPTGVDIQYVYNGDLVDTTGFFFQYQGTNYTSPAAIEALRASTGVDYGLGKGTQRQIDHESNYSFDYGNAHFTFLDANPHLFAQLLPGVSTQYPFPAYPSVLRQWLLSDLDGSAQPWKVVVFHQPAFSSGNATLANDQMRRVAKLLEDHGVNLVFNGHEHNYQRTLPLRALAGVTQDPSQAGPPAVAIDPAFDGTTRTVPDGVIYLVEGAGGNRDFDDNLPGPRGSTSASGAIDQDDAARGTNTVSGHVFSNGPSSWLDTHLTDNAMTSIPGAGSGPKITAVFKSKVFSFADVAVDGPVLTLYQISEPLSGAPPAAGMNFGTDYTGGSLNAPLPDTVIDPATGANVASAGEGTPALLDKFTITRPSVSQTVSVSLSAPPSAVSGGALVYSLALANRGTFALNGTQVVLTLPAGVSLAATTSDVLTQQGATVELTVGRLAPGQKRYVQIPTRVALGTAGFLTTPPVTLRSSTAQSVISAPATTRVIVVPPPRPRR